MLTLANWFGSRIPSTSIDIVEKTICSVRGFGLPGIVYVRKYQDRPTVLVTYKSIINSPIDDFESFMSSVNIKDYCRSSSVAMTMVHTLMNALFEEECYHGTQEAFAIVTVVKIVNYLTETLSSVVLSFTDETNIAKITSVEYPDDSEFVKSFMDKVNHIFKKY